MTFSSKYELQDFSGLRFQHVSDPVASQHAVAVFVAGVSHLQHTDWGTNEKGRASRWRRGPFFAAAQKPQ
jgi:hypothetical protein